MNMVLLLSSITYFVGCSNDTTKGVLDTQNVDTAAPIQDNETEDSGEIADTSGPEIHLYRKIAQKRSRKSRAIAVMITAYILRFRLVIG